ncbi:MAG: hypothetical protein WBA23_07410 [Tunicatimonas sp.]
MKSIVKNFGRLIMITSIPLMLLASCDSDLVEPENAMPPKKTFKKPQRA